MNAHGKAHAGDAGAAGVVTADAASLDARAALRASRRRRVFGALGGGMVGSGLAAVAVSALNFWLGKPPTLVWVGVALGLPLAVVGAGLILRIGD